MVVVELKETGVYRPGHPLSNVDVDESESLLSPPKAAFPRTASDLETISFATLPRLQTEGLTEPLDVHVHEMHSPC